MNRFLILILIVASIGLFFFYIRPTYTDTILPAQQQIASYNKALDASKSFAQKENSLLAEKNAIPADSLNRLETFLPDDVDNIQLILDMSALAARTGVTLSNFSVQGSGSSADASASNSGSSPTLPTPSSSGSSFNPSGLTDSLQLSVSISATYPQFRTFLAATQDSLRTLDATSLSVSSGGTIDTYNISYNLYWLH